MPKVLKIFLFAIGGLAGMLLLAALAVWLLVDIDTHKPRVEAAASTATGMTVTVEGRLGLRFVPGLHVALENVRIHNRGTELAFIKEADLAVDLLPLFRRQLHYGSIVTNGARISIERGRDGRYNYEKTPAAIAASHPLDLPRVSFADLIVAYADKQSGNGFEFSGCNGELTDMRHPGGVRLLTRLSVSGQFTCSEVRGKNPAISELKFSVEATDGVFDIKPVTMRAFDGNGSGTMHMDRSAEVPIYQVSYALSKFRLEELFKAPASGKSVSGLMDFTTKLSMRGKTRIEMRQSATGEMSLSGKNLTLGGVDLDKELPKYESSQSFNLIDLGALLFAGPIGLVVTKGVEFSSLARQTGGSTRIGTVVSQWKVEKGVAYALDVAMATNENRLAIHGGLDFVDNEYHDLTVALIDANGCAKVRQRIRGPFGTPTADKSSILVPVGPLLKLLDKAKTLISGSSGKCEVFYSGSVASPK